jgi:hypothetical protein
MQFKESRWPNGGKTCAVVAEIVSAGVPAAHIMQLHFERKSAQRTIINDYKNYLEPERNEL